MKVIDPAGEYPFGEPDPTDNVVPLRPRTEEVAFEHMTDTGNARRMVALFGDQIRYCPARRSWYVWDGRIWARDTTLEIHRIAKATVRRMQAEATRIKDDDERKRRLMHCIASESTGRLRAMVENAQSETTIEPTDLDANPMLLCVENGTLDLRTGRLRAHSPADFITLMAPVEYHPRATDPRWEDVLDRFVRPDDGKEEFLRRAAFASITGKTSDKVFINLYDDNDGNTGKTTFTESLMMMLGPYATVVNAETFLSSRGAAGIRADLAACDGKRMVVSGEIPAGRQLDVAQMKRLTQGGGTLSFERKYENPWTGPITFTIWLDGNSVAKAPAEDSPLFNRWRLTPFKHKIEGRPDPTWLDRVRDSPEYRSAVLAWVMKGRRAWLKGGIGSTPMVDAATAEIQESMDPLGEFWEQWCVFGPGLCVTNADLRIALDDWHQSAGKTHTINDTAWRALLTAKGARPWAAPRRLGGKPQRGWDGVALSAPAPARDGKAPRMRVKRS